MTWKIETQKNCIHERRVFSGDYEVDLVIYWRSGYITFDEMPDLSNYDPGDGIEINDFDDWRFRDGSTDLEIGDDTPADEREKIEKAYAEDGEDGLEALGYDIRDTTYLFLGDLKITDITAEFIEKIKANISDMEDNDNLEDILLNIENELGLADGIRTDLYEEALRKGLEFCEDEFDFEEYCELVSKTLDDDALKRKAMQQIRSNADDAHDLANLASAALEQLEDQSLAGEIFDEGLTRATSNRERTHLFRVALQALKDSGRAKKLLGYIEEEADYSVCREVAEVISKYAEDSDWAGHWYAKSLELVTDWEQQYRLIGSIDYYLDDSTLVKGAFERYDYLKSAGFSHEHPYWQWVSKALDHLILMSPKGPATSDHDGVHTFEESAFNESSIWESGQNVFVFLLPGQYAGPLLIKAYEVFSLVGLGNPEDVVVSTNSANTIALESGQLHIQDLTIVRDDSEDAEKFSAILASGDVSIHVQNCTLTSPGGYAFAAVGEDAPLAEISNCRVINSANGIYGGAGRTRIDNVFYKNVTGFQASAGGNGLLEEIEDRHRDLAALVKNELFFNLYEFDEDWMDSDDLYKYRSEEGADLFERVYYACALDQNMPEMLQHFFSKHLPDIFEKQMFPPATSSHPLLGIYNVRLNRFCAIGLDNKGHVFKMTSHSDLDWDVFCCLDHANIAEAINNRVEKIGQLHLEFLASDDKDEKEEFKKKRKELWQILYNAVPTISEDVFDF
jgi:hypothetical protein